MATTLLTAWKPGAGIVVNKLQLRLRNPLGVAIARIYVHVQVGVASLKSRCLFTCVLDVSASGQQLTFVLNLRERESMCVAQLRFI